MPKVALVETKKSRTNFKESFDGLDFDQYQLCSDPTIKKVLKRDCDIDMNPDDYDWIILVGSDAMKYYTKLSSVTEYSGKKVEKKFLPIINPAMLAFKPEAKKVWEDGKQSILEYINDEKEDVVIDSSIAFGIQDTEEANDFIRAAIAEECEYVALDSETTGLYPRDGYMLGISLAYNNKFGAYIDTDCFSSKTERLLQELFTKKTVVFHNAKFDMAFFEYHFHFKFPQFEDTMLLHYLINENPGGHGLKQLTMKFTPYGDYEKPMYDWIDQYRKEHGILKDQFNWGDIPFDVMKTYAGMDALCTLLIYEKFVKIKQNSKLKWVYDNILIPGTRFLIDTQDNGVPFDKKRLYLGQDAMQTDIDNAITALYENDNIRRFEELNGKPFNPNSTVQLRSLLFDYLGLQPTGKKTGTGANSTDAEVLNELSLQSDVPKQILAIRQKSKIKNTYLDKIIPQLDRDSRLRTGFNLHGTTSGRLSSSGKLNMQQLPRDNPTVKGCIKAAPGHKIVAMDLTTAEVYVAAILANDKALIEVFRSGGNFHSTIAHKVFRLPCDVEDVAELYPDKRQAAKAVTFGIMYGAGPAKISDQVTKDSGKNFSKQEAQEVITDYFRAFHKLKAWIDDNQKFIEQNGFIYSYFGRKRRLPNVKSEDPAIRSHSVRSGLNFLVQSAASDINLLGAIDMGAYIKSKGMKARIFALVHDSILAEVPEDEIEHYNEKLLQFVQMDRGLIIPGAPVGCDFEVDDDYSMGKFAKMYGDSV
ncbi:MAG TPA: DNA polymerase [Saprospirales bacterium]|jgi:DNA polymerase I-like protein with 3'-5' exonuclease and polymerase domains|nr:DNA polymerase [Saprospirales bacterium]HCD67818.1 DNA polymerase [Bacteroidota bacterium]